MLGEILGAVGGGVGSFLSYKAQQKAYRDRKRMLEELLAFQRHQQASGINALAQARASYENDPARARLRARYDEMLANPTSWTPEFVSGLKSQALGANARQTNAGIVAANADARRRGLGNSPIAAALAGGVRSRGDANVNALTTSIDTQATEGRRRDTLDATNRYQAFLDGDFQNRYGFTRDMVGLLAGTQYGNSLALTGMGG